MLPKLAICKIFESVKHLLFIYCLHFGSICQSQRAKDNRCLYVELEVVNILKDQW